MYSTKEYLIGFILVLSTATSSWLALKSTSAEEATAAQANVVESYMTQAVVVQMNGVTGSPQYLLQSPLLEHYTAGDITKITRPHLTILQPDSAPWYLSADQGQASNGLESVKLQNNVVLFEPQSAQNPTMTITTSAATIYPKRQYAESDQLIIATQPDKKLQAVGMQTYFKTGIINLLSQVQGDYRGDIQ